MMKGCITDPRSVNDAYDEVRKLGLLVLGAGVLALFEVGDMTKETAVLMTCTGGALLVAAHYRLQCNRG